MSKAPAVRTVDRLRGAPWLSGGGVAKALALLNSNGEQARVVGGAVRNALLGLDVGEVDIATTAVPDEVIRRAKAAKIKFAPTGVEHGTVTLIIGKHPYEVTTLREDVETFGRKARVAFGRDWQRDAERRDFTISALSASADGTVYDYTGGLDDLAQRRVRFIGEPARRIAEDYLRILRFFRIHAAYGEGPVDRDGLNACIAGRAGLANLSAERIRSEMLKLLIARGAASALQEMSDGGLLLALLGGVTYHPSFAAMVAAEQQLGLDADVIRRLAALAVATVEDAERLTVRLRLSNAESEQLRSMAHRWWRLASIDDAQGRVRLYKLGPDRYRDRVLFGWARKGGDAGYWQGLATLGARWAAPVFPVKAADLMARGLRPGPALGAALARAEQFWIDAGFPSGKGELAAIVDRAMEDQEGPTRGADSH
ncbi:CCA tRNA nucleotidyltransferase [Bradyrhizobium sp. LHD-71]|uniref:CCA tRNA nucleotidyltransferase n=1 Tax=Bradyrhizobium sp. LHD-71 TaxID=3072141 RepID=UPI00281034C5|nr:CCA tRNA nucleotidyltransferase [Bradyrhizobium sp. LHD-71]MDQ8730715.1 CCA tRNA nucleotidyltransferase [Bradyrhizobium sp. LHD-71]